MALRLFIARNRLSLVSTRHFPNHTPGQLLSGPSPHGGRASVTLIYAFATNRTVALDKAYALALWLIAKTCAMPRAHRFTLGDRIYSQSLDLVTTLTQATFSRDKLRALETASESRFRRTAKFKFPVTTQYSSARSAPISKPHLR